MRQGLTNLGFLRTNCIRKSLISKAIPGTTVSFRTESMITPHYRSCEAIPALAHPTVRPAATRRSGHATSTPSVELLRDRLVRLSTTSALENVPRAQCLRLRPQLFALAIDQHELRLWPSSHLSPLTVATPNDMSGRTPLIQRLNGAGHWDTAVRFELCPKV